MTGLNKHIPKNQTDMSKKIPLKPKHEHFISFPRRVRAQEAIGEIEKERILLKQKLDIRNSDYEQKAQVCYPRI